MRPGSTPRAINQATRCTSVAVLPAAGHDQQRRVAVRGGLPLLGIQLLQKIFNRKGLRHAVPCWLRAIIPTVDPVDKAWRPQDAG